MLKHYFNQFNPLVKLIITNTILAATSDFIAQKALLEAHEPFDFVRLSRFALYQGSITPIIYKWLQFLEKRYPMDLTKKEVSKKLNRAYIPLFKKVLVDQVVMAPLLTFTFFSVMTLLEGGNAYFTTLINGWKVWPFVQLVNFFYVPFMLRIPFTGCIGLIWNVYISFVNNQSTQKNIDLSD